MPSFNPPYSLENLPAAASMAGTDSLAITQGGADKTIQAGAAMNGLGQTAAQLGAASACSVTDTLPVSQGGSALVLQTFSAVFVAAATYLSAQPQQQVIYSSAGTLLLNAQLHNKANIVITAPCAIAPPTSFSSFGAGSDCDVTNLSGGNVVFTTTTNTNSGGIVTSSSGTLANFGVAKLKSTTALGAGGAIVLSILGAAASTTPSMTVTSVTGLTPGGTSTCNFSFSNATPTSVTAALDGSALTISGIMIGASSGSFTFTTPAAGTHSLVITGTGANTASSNAYSFTATTSNSISVTGVSPLTAGGTSTTSFSYTGSAPSSVTATIDGSAATITVGSISGGTGSFTFTAPTAGTHALIVTGTGANTSASSSYSFTTSAGSSNPYSLTLTSGNTFPTSMHTYSASYFFMTLTGGTPTRVDAALYTSNTTPPTSSVPAAQGTYLSSISTYGGAHNYAPSLGINASVTPAQNYYLWFIVTDGSGTYSLCYPTACSIGN